MEKQFVGAQTLLEDSFRLAVKIHASGFRPDYIVGIWRGGTPVGVVVHDFLAYVGIDVDHISVRTSYHGMEFYHAGQAAARTQVHSTRYLVDRVNSGDSLLIVDDVYASGRSVDAVIRKLGRKLRRNMPGDIRVAVPWVKPAQNKTGRTPDYFLHETGDWLIMPHELNGLTDEEIKKHKPLVHELARQVLRGT